MQNDLQVHRAMLSARRASCPPRPRLALLAALLTSFTCAATCALAILAPAPAGVVPLIAAVCVGCPMFASWNVSDAIAAVRADRRAMKALAGLRRTLAQLPETEHPLGF